MPSKQRVRLGEWVLGYYWSSVSAPKYHVYRRFLWWMRESVVLPPVRVVQHKLWLRRHKKHLKWVEEGVKAKRAEAAK